jgi:Holliday junction resolvase-like predicted endonuclease
MNIGEEICGEWLRHVSGCEFVQYNLRTSDVQGEIDVIGISLATHTVYACEVAIHLTTGLQYVKDRRPDNVPRLTAKFRKDVMYVRKAFPGYGHVFMLWSPVVKNQGTGAKYNQVDDVERIVQAIQHEFGETVQRVINEKFKEALDALRRVAAEETKELDSSVTRLLQVEEHLARHLKRLKPSSAAKP